jgi:hypothetical protein
MHGIAQIQAYRSFHIVTLSPMEMDFSFEKPSSFGAWLLFSGNFDVHLQKLRHLSAYTIKRGTATVTAPDCNRYSTPIRWAFSTLATRQKWRFLQKSRCLASG